MPKGVPGIEAVTQGRMLGALKKLQSTPSEPIPFGGLRKGFMGFKKRPNKGQMIEISLENLEKKNQKTNTLC